MEHEGSKVVVIGGGMIGTSVAWWLSSLDDFAGTILVIERDPTYAQASTSLTNSCIRQQFSNPLNIQISRFGVEFIRNFRRFIGDPEIPDIFFDEFGYLYLANQPTSAAVLERNHATQRREGATTELLSADELGRRWPFMNTDDVVMASFGPRDEGYFDSGTMFGALRQAARANGVQYVNNSVIDIVTNVDLRRGGRRVTAVVLSNGLQLNANWVVNAAGPRAADIAAMVDVALPVEPRKRYSWVFQCATELGGVLPLTIDPTRVHVRQDGAAFLAGAHSDADPAVAFDDFSVDQFLFDDKVWPALAHRVPAFERIKVTSAWAGHYAYNTFDQNAILGAHPDISNFIFANGFSGHGLQQSPAVGRGIAEWITYGEYRTLDLTPLGYQRILANEPFVEANII